MSRATQNKSHQFELIVLFSFIEDTPGDATVIQRRHWIDTENELTNYRNGASTYLQQQNNCWLIHRIRCVSFRILLAKTMKFDRFGVFLLWRFVQTCCFFSRPATSVWWWAPSVWRPTCLHNFISAIFINNSFGSFFLLNSSRANGFSDVKLTWEIRITRTNIGCNSNERNDTIWWRRRRRRRKSANFACIHFVRGTVASHWLRVRVVQLLCVFHSLDADKRKWLREQHISHKYW